jgi:hypothetical protein
MLKTPRYVVMAHAWDKTCTGTLHFDRDAL